MTTDPFSPVKRSRLARKVCVLMSAGVDSSILVDDLLAHGFEVHPLYVRCGFRWETVELFWLRRLLRRLKRPALKPLAVRTDPVAASLPRHWSTSGRNVPGFHSLDKSVYLPGRNLVLYSQAGFYCGLKDVPWIASGVLKGNPFSDAQPAFNRAMSTAIGRAFSRDIRVVTPYAKLKKAQVLARRPGFPLELTYSCLKPRGLSHCGSCNKCAERQRVLRLSAAGAASSGRRPASA